MNRDLIRSDRCVKANTDYEHYRYLIRPMRRNYRTYHMKVGSNRNLIPPMRQNYRTNHMKVGSRGGLPSSTALKVDAGRRFKTMASATSAPDVARQGVLAGLLKFEALKATVETLEAFEEITMPLSRLASVVMLAKHAVRCALNMHVCGPFRCFCRCFFVMFLPIFLSCVVGFIFIFVLLIKLID